MSFGMKGFVCSVLLLAIVAHSYRGVEARQIRINRYSTSVQEDEAPSVQTEVREGRKAPYPAAGYRPGRAFFLPGEGNNVEIQFGEEGSGFGTTTTEVPLDLTTTTTNYDLETTTANADTFTEEPDSRSGRNLEGEINGPANVTIDSISQRPQTRKAPYPAAGYRPSRAFRLPTEIESEAVEAEPTTPPSSDKSKHPVCGVSTDPLAPKPADGAKDDPDAERVAITVPIGRAVVVARAPVAIPLIAARSQPLIAAQPQLVTRPFVYTAQLQTW